MSLFRNFLQFLPGGQTTDTLNPDLLTWALKLDARSITGVADGAPLALWPDTSGNARNATVLFAAPLYRATGSPTGAPAVDFNGSRDMHGTLPAIPLDVSQGLTMVAYILQDTVDPADGGGLNAQSILGCYTGTDMRLYGVIYPLPNAPQVGGRTSAVGGDIGSGTTAITGSHTLCLVCQPPSGALGPVRVFRDGNDIGGWFNWTCQPNTEYIVSGNGVGNIPIKGKLCFVGFTTFALTPSQVRGLHGYFRSVFG